MSTTERAKEQGKDGRLALITVPNKTAAQTQGQRYMGANVFSLKPTAKLYRIVRNVPAIPGNGMKYQRPGTFRK